MTKKRVFIVHCWGGDSKANWYPALKDDLEKLGHEVYLPDMPNTDEPEITNWISHLATIVGHVDETTYFIGHSIGCQTIMRYLESLPEGTKVGGALFVAGWFTLMNLGEEEIEVARPWLESDIDLDKVKQYCPRIYAIFSSDDPVVPTENLDLFREKLNAHTKMFENLGHIESTDATDKILELFLSLESA